MVATGLVPGKWYAPIVCWPFLAPTGGDEEGSGNPYTSCGGIEFDKDRTHVEYDDLGNVVRSTDPYVFNVYYPDYEAFITKGTSARFTLAVDPSPVSTTDDMGDYSSSADCGYNGTPCSLTFFGERTRVGTDFESR